MNIFDRQVCPLFPLGDGNEAYDAAVSFIHSGLKVLDDMIDVKDDQLY